ISKLLSVRVLDIWDAAKAIDDAGARTYDDVRTQDKVGLEASRCRDCRAVYGSDHGPVMADWTNAQYLTWQTPIDRLAALRISGNYQYSQSIPVANKPMRDHLNAAPIWWKVGCHHEDTFRQ